MQELTLDIGGPVHVVDHGGDGPTMLLVHGLGGSLVDWSDVARGLSRRHHVYAVDLIGFGRTPLAGRRSDIGDNWRLVDAVIDRVSGGRPVVLVGNSMGALINIVVAAKRRGKVAALVLVNPALPRWHTGRFNGMVPMAFATLSTPGLGPLVLGRSVAMAGPERLVDNILRLCALDSRRINPATRDAQIELTRWREGQDRPYRAFVEASRSLVRWLWNPATIAHFIDRVTAPTLLLHGDHDYVVELAAAQLAADRRPDWTFHVFEQTGHIPQMERPREFVDVVGRWVEGVDGSLPAAVPQASTGRPSGAGRRTRRRRRPNSAPPGQLTAGSAGA